jgi:hypothetical protein
LEAFVLMRLYAFNAVDASSGALTGVLVNYNEKKYPSVLSQVMSEHPTKFGFRHVPFLPVWVKDLYPVWQQWQCLHTEGRFNLGAFELPLQRISYRRVYHLRADTLRQTYDPFKLTRWLWGCDTFTPEDVISSQVERAARGQHTRHGNLTWEQQALRVKDFALTPAYDPIIVCTDYHLSGKEIMIEEGNHRFAGAIVRNDLCVRAYCVGDMSIINKYRAD